MICSHNRNPKWMVCIFMIFHDVPSRHLNFNIFRLYNSKGSNAIRRRTCCKTTLMITIKIVDISKVLFISIRGVNTAWNKVPISVLIIIRRMSIAWSKGSISVSLILTIFFEPVQMAPVCFTNIPELLSKLDKKIYIKPPGLSWIMPHVVAMWVYRIYKSCKMRMSQKLSLLLE